MPFDEHHPAMVCFFVVWWYGVLGAYLCFVFRALA